MADIGLGRALSPEGDPARPVGLSRLTSMAAHHAGRAIKRVGRQLVMVWKLARAWSIRLLSMSESRRGRRR
jgi:hypothetical protein